jgi:hypothetical protein
MLSFLTFLLLLFNDASWHWFALWLVLVIANLFRLSFLE